MSDARLWSGRFAEPPALEAHALGRSLGFDLRLAPQDVRASIAHVHALRDAGLLDEEETRALEAALVDVGREIAAGRLVPDERDEDVHSVVERAVTERLGDLGAKLHAGRSRNDLVITDLRLWLREAGAAIAADLAEFAGAIVTRATEHAADPMPGTTHGRAAQPVTLGHHLLAHAWALARDLDRLDGWAIRAAVSPLGAGAIATSTLGLDPAATAARLGFGDAFANSVDAVSDRDVVQEFLAVAAICAAHLSRLAADLTRWTDPALGWATLAEPYTTGSSMMPQKRNPDTAELSRGKAARIAGGFVTVTAMLQGLPLGYHRDLQEDKEPAFDAADTLRLVIPALAGTVATMTFDTDAMRAACADEGLYATDLAEALVRAGVPFSDAHHRTGALLRDLEIEGRSLGDLDADAWAAFGLPDGATLLDPDRAIAARGGPGGPSPRSVRHQVETLRARRSERPVHDAAGPP
jgi:argininosuccinate lyase